MIINNEHKLCRAFSQLSKTRITFKLFILYTARVNDACQPDHSCSNGGSNSRPTAPKASALPLSYTPLQNFLVLDKERYALSKLSKSSKSTFKIEYKKHHRRLMPFHLV